MSLPSASASANGISQRSTKRLYYVDVPMMIRAYYTFGKVRIYAGTGPQVSVGLFVQDVTRTTGKHFRNKFSETSAFSDKTRRYELAWDFDAGISIPVKEHAELQINIRPMTGLINIAKEEFNEDNNRNLLVAFGLAWIYGR